MRPSGTSHCHPIHRQRESLLHQRAVAEFGVGRRIRGVRGVLEDRKDPLGAAVARFVEEPAVAARGVDRLEEIEVRRELDQALRVLRREIQVDDAAVLRPRRIKGEVHLADELFVRSGRAERLPVEHDFAPFDLQSIDAGFDVDAQRRPMIES